MIANRVLLTDLYQLTMLQTYFEQRMEDTAVFELFVRKLPQDRGFLLAAGLEQALNFLLDMHFDQDELEWLATTGMFKKAFLDWLATLKFAGDVHAVPEGTVFFPQEPVIRVTAPLPQAQLIESRLINLIHFQTLIASKAVRSVLAAPDKLLVDFGFRRAHGAEAGLMAARASYLAGFTGTATVAAGPLFGIPVYGTMAHSLIQAHHDESEAFARFAQANPGNAVLLIDTYDTEAAAQKVVELVPRLKAQGITIRGVRLDSGDLNVHARRVRNILDHGGLRQTTIFASGNLDEYRIAQLLAQRAPIDGFGIGTHLATSSDAPYLDCVYKLQEYAGAARRKRSEGKATWPGRKQVYRHFDADGIMAGDTITLDDAPADGKALLQPVLRGGRLLASQPTLADIRAYVSKQLDAVPPGLKALKPALIYPVQISGELIALTQAVDDEHR